MIERVEVDVGEKLASLIPNGNAPPPLAGLEQVVAGKIVDDLFLRIAAINDLLNQPVRT